MYTYNDLVAALQSGVSVEDIAAQMSKDLNAAKAEYDRLAAERAETEKQAAAEARKRDIMRDFYAALGTYVTEFYPDSLIAEMIVDAGTPSDEYLDQLAEQVDTLVATVETMKNLSELLGDVEFNARVATNPNIKTVDIDPIEAFLNKNVRKH